MIKANSNKTLLRFSVRLLRWAVGTLIAVLLLLQLYVYYPVLSSPVDGYLSRKASIQSVNISKQWRQNGSDYTELDLTSSSGLRVQMLIRKPASQLRPLPVAILLGGVGTGRNACGLIPEIRNVICVSLSYPYYGDSDLEGVAFFYNLREVQQAIKDTPPAVLLTLDYMLTQPYSDRRQTELIGVSFGAYFISIPAVLDQRVSRVWIVQGAAEPNKVIAHNFLKHVDSMWLRSLAAHLIGYAMGSQHVDPEKWVGRISPRPLIFINAESDEALPRTSVTALHEAARQPREIIWTRGEHITPGRGEIIEQLSNIVLKRIEGEYEGMTGN